MTYNCTVFAFIILFLKLIASFDILFIYTMSLNINEVLLPVLFIILCFRGISIKMEIIKTFSCHIHGQRVQYYI